MAAEGNEDLSCLNRRQGLPGRRVQYCGGALSVAFAAPAHPQADSYSRNDKYGNDGYWNETLHDDRLHPRYYTSPLRLSTPQG